MGLEGASPNTGCGAFFIPGELKLLNVPSPSCLAPGQLTLEREWEQDQQALHLPGLCVFTLGSVTVKNFVIACHSCGSAAAAPSSPAGPQSLSRAAVMLILHIRSLEGKWDCFSHRRSADCSRALGKKQLCSKCYCKGQHHSNTVLPCWAKGVKAQSVPGQGRFLSGSWCKLLLKVNLLLIPFCAATGRAPRGSRSITFLPSRVPLRASSHPHGAAPAPGRRSGGGGGWWLSLQRVARGVSASPSSENVLSRLSLGGHG